ncbi:ribonuclease J [Magnetospirillum sulfuroxidans]|uniref:Ribonuclease J n=1 Tax=Magnetospirillum sulfuroxidans TaxID=611300 RepID=A0ABS5I8I2_9PROT|nr:ribonuclease J [Magnetospirillum sulfuroxidans]MBR9970742.1 ribonuclease J [Magnetospirillum sulfuroxidans]
MKPGSDELFFLPLGGTGEIGMNFNLYGHDGKWLIVDLGVTFGDDSMPMTDVVMADPAWIEERRDQLVGIVITHGHEDHVGAVHYLWSRLKCPVYASPFAAAILAGKLNEVGLQRQVPMHVVALGSRFDVGPFNVEMVSMTHSIPEPNSLAIRTKAGTVLHTGDWKFDPDPLIGNPADTEALRRIGNEGVLAMVGDSTNIFTRGHSGSEAEVRANLIGLLSRYDRRIAISCFATNVARLESVALAAEANGRSVALVGRSLWRIEKAARDLGYLRDIAPFLNDRDAVHLPADKVVYLCTGSQGEPRAALARIAANDHPNVRLSKGDVVIFSSRIIPGNEKSIFRLQNDLVRMGVDVVTDRDEPIHVSGHPARDEMEAIYQYVRPRIAVPVHGEARHIKEHCALAKACGVAETMAIENGAMLRLAPGKPEVVDHVSVGRLAVDGEALEGGPRLVRLDSAVLRDRRRMVFNGSCVCTIVVDRKGKLLGEPQVTALGLLDAEHFAEEHDNVVEAAREAFEELPQKARQDDATAAEAVRRAVRRELKAMLNHRPITTVHLVRV